MTLLRRFFADTGPFLLVVLALYLAVKSSACQCAAIVHRHTHDCEQH